MSNNNTFPAVQVASPIWNNRTVDSNDNTAAVIRSTETPSLDSADTNLFAYSGANLLLNAFSAARAGLSLAPLIVERSFDIASRATRFGLECGKEAVNFTENFINNSLNISAAGLIAVLETIAKSDQINAEQAARIEIIKSNIQQHIETVNTGVAIGSSLIREAILDSVEVLAISGIDFSRFITNQSLNLAGTVVKSMDEGIQAALAEQGIEVDSIQSNSILAAIAEICEITQEMDNRLRSVTHFEITQALFTYSSLVSTVATNECNQNNTAALNNIKQNHHALLQTDKSLSGAYRAKLFAMCAYGPNFLKFLGYSTKATTRKQFVCEVCKIDRKDIILTSWNSSISQPGFYLAYDHASKSIILAIRGSSRIVDAVTDLRCDYEKYKNGTVHRGMFVAAKYFDINVKQRVVDALAVQPAYSLIIAGHSLGAGVASLLALLWKNDPILDSQERPMRCYAFAAPCVASKELTELGKGTVKSVVLGDDLVCRLSAGSVRDLTTVIKLLTTWSRRAKREQQDHAKRNTNNSNGSAIVVEDVSEVEQKLEGNRVAMSHSLGSPRDQLTQRIQAVHNHHDLHELLKTYHKAEPGSMEKAHLIEQLSSVLKEIRQHMTAEKHYPVGDIYHILFTKRPVVKTSKLTAYTKSLIVAQLAPGYSESSDQQQGHNSVEMKAESSLQRAHYDLMAGKFEDLNELLLTSNSLADHLPEQYYAALHSLFNSPLVEVQLPLDHEMKNNNNAVKDS
jgi:hypothetical protein